MAGIAYQWLANSEMPLAAMYRQLKDDMRSRLQPPETVARTGRARD
jgi:hypothetical protein